MAGKLYLCATPIGNLEDMSFRAVRSLLEADLIAAEDTRNSIKLLNHFNIHTPMTSYHEYNKIEKGHYLVEQMLARQERDADHRCGNAGDFRSGGRAGADVPRSRDHRDAHSGACGLHQCADHFRQIHETVLL